MRSDTRPGIINAMDQALMLWIQTKRIPPVTALLKIVTYSGSGKVWFAYATVLNLLGRAEIQLIPAQGAFVRAMLCALIAWGVGSPIKKWINRPRPADAIEGYATLVKAPSCRSFPSSHASSAVAFFVALSLIHHELAPVVGAWAALVAFSRVYLGVHYPSDVLGGGVLGFACGWLVFPIENLLG